ncbi:Vacuolar-sorting protein snf7 (Vacuolar protein-sorting-associated protein 32), partial [Durusdinium trenchii]
SKAAARSQPAKKPQVSETLDQAAKLKATVGRLEQRRDFIEKKMMNELKQAKAKNQRGDKKGALAHLRRKKLYEKEVEKINNGMLNLEQQVMAIESSSVTVDIVNAMKTGKSAMQQVTAGLDPDAVADLQDDIADLSARQNEIDDVLAAPIGLDDQGELEDELAELEAAELEEGLDALPAVPTQADETPIEKLPAAPTHTPAIAQEEDDDAALRELEAEMAA